MSYIPKKLVNTGLYATGDQFLDLQTKKPYRGPYHSNVNGPIFSGVDPYDPNKKRLIPNPDSKSYTPPKTRVLDTPSNNQYNTLNNTNTPLLKYGEDPKSFTPKPIIKDYERGSITRYFAKRIIEKPNRIIEVNADAYNSIQKRDGKFNYAVWRVHKVLWRISGKSEEEVTKTNKTQVDNANKNFPGIKSYLRNLLQFYKKREDVEKVLGLLGRGRRRRTRRAAGLRIPAQTPRPTNTQRGTRNIPRGDLY